MSTYNTLSFFSSLDSQRYREYRFLKAEIFARELNWKNMPLNTDGSAIEDEFDKESIFLGCFDSNGSLCGAIRGTSLEVGFPHEKFFALDCDESDMQLFKTHGFTLNALCIKKIRRGKNFTLQSKSYLSIAHALMEHISDYFFERERFISLITVENGARVRFFKSIGYLPLGDAFQSVELNKEFVNLRHTISSTLDIK